ncbi:alpha/beta fold hydrolase [Tardiphaga alba]|uniref:Alpha/beta fold hydrolase n=1 Tax=Tardiphaga alba TaxID=340268 RepID=A0ABX8AF91_9BRAD|nr:alpha/beta fold hydrolase [Tardiphaga alba]QUS41947.1 alpha/beta fold hydrolase [Tardiphaga alba]
MATIVLVHGAWHGKWCWQPLIPLLESRGHKVVAVDLLGMGDDPTPIKDVSLGRWTDQIVDVVKVQSEPVVLLGHSRGGIVISEVAERVPDSVAKLVYLAAFLLPSGETLGGFVARVSGGAKAPYVIPGADGKTSTVSADAVQQVFYNTAPAELVRVAEAKMGAEPMAVFATPLSSTAERFGRVPRAYIETKQDRAVPLALQKAMHSALACSPIVTLDTDHCPFFSAPDHLAAAIDKIATEEINDVSAATSHQGR